MTPPEPVDKDTDTETVEPPAPGPTVGPVSALAQRGKDVVREGSHRLREQALYANEATLRYIQTEPVKAMLFAAATGAALMALALALTQPLRRD